MAETSCSILLVDDRPEVIDVVRTLFELEGYRVSTAADGAEALASLRSGFRPRVIVLDLMMPSVNGWEFRRQQLADTALCEIPLVIFSAVASIDRESVEQLHAAAVVEKSDGVLALLIAIEQICGSRS